jgi:hypothetical protein
MNRRIDQALGGSDVIRGYTDQGSAGDPNYMRGGVGVNINRERFNDWGYAGSREWRERREREIAQAGGPQTTAQQPAPQGGPAPRTDGTTPSGAGTPEVGPRDALAIARTHLSEDEIRDESKLSSFFAKNGIRISPKTTAWCAAFVNSTLSEAGKKGTGSLAAASFYKYGSPVRGESKEGDIAVWPHHVALATGEHRVGPGGQQQFQVIGGNQGGTVSGRGGVSYSWRNVSGATLRRPDWDTDSNRQTVDAARSQDVNVNATGKLTADINAPPGTKVKMEGDGLFKKTEVNRQTQMEPAAVGPAQSGGS